MLLLLLACFGADKDDDDDDDDDDDTTESATTEDEGFPPDPGPITLEVSGGYDGTLVFDAPSCTYLDTTPNFRTFWRNSRGEHVFVLLAEVLGAFEGPGEYDQTMTTTRVKLQEEAGGAGYYFGSEGGDTVSIHVAGLENGQAWGEFSFSGLADGSVTASPQPIPIWCADLL